MHQRQVAKANGASMGLLCLLLACFLTMLPILLCQENVPVEPFSETTESPDSEKAPVDPILSANCSKYSNEQSKHIPIANKLVSICKNCSELYRLPSLGDSCRTECFTTVFFLNCVEKLIVLKKEKVTAELRDMIMTISDGVPLIK